MKGFIEAKDFRADGKELPKTYAKSMNSLGLLINTLMDDGHYELGHHGLGASAFYTMQTRTLKIHDSQMTMNESGREGLGYFDSLVVNNER